MFNEISPQMKSRMTFLEQIDKKDRSDGTERLKRLRQIPPKTGKFLALLAANCPEGEFIEIGTSAGYSTMWISLALKNRNEILRTFEVLPEKIQLAKETFSQAEIKHKVDLIEGDFLSNTNGISSISFCFLDCEKHLYDSCYDIVSEKLIPGGILIADNAINHYKSLKNMMEKAEKDDRFDCLTIPLGKGEFICRRK